MAAAYASLVSLMHIIDQIMDHGHNSFSLNQEQIQTLQERAAFLVDFLEGYSHGDNKEAEGLESRIADTSHAAEDLIESKVVDYIHENQSTIYDETRSNPFCQELQDVIEVMDFMKKKAMKIKEKGEVKVHLPGDQIRSRPSISLPVGKDIMVGFDDVLIQIMDRLTGQQSNRLVIPIYGMGGIGKTTLTRNVYENPYIVQHFDMRAWVTISQEYEIKEILSNLLCEFGVLGEVSAQEMNESQLGEKLHKHLFGRKYLIVMDDMWSIDVWDKLRFFFPDNGNGSGTLITTRLSNMASHLGSLGLEMNFLDEDQSWNLLHHKVFGQQECSLQLEEIGKKIAKNCKGLPLSIGVIAGLLAKSNMTREYWDHVAKEVNSIVSLADDGQCSKILSLSYKNLPIHLKPCFLYMGVFSKDRQIRVSQLIKLWVAEGFLKPNKAKSLEEVAEEYLIELIDRNLIMVHERGSRGKMKYCKIHDLLRDLCLREAQNEKFLCVIGERDFDSSQALHNQRRIVIDKSKKEQKDSASFHNHGAIYVSLPRSITFSTTLDSSLLGCRLTRVLNGVQHDIFEIAFNLVNLRYLYVSSLEGFFWYPSTINLWNLQTLKIRGASGITAPHEIWEMKQLRHLYMYIVNMPEPPPIASIDGQEDPNMRHLQTLKGISNLTCSEGVVKRIPNIKRLNIYYIDIFEDLDGRKDYCLVNLQHLHKLESLIICLRVECPLLENVIFPQSLKKLSLDGSHISWEHMTIIGCLPNLEVLRLYLIAFIEQEWNLFEGQFISLKYLELYSCNRLKFWDADSIHFPNFEQLLLNNMTSLEKIPLGIGEIATLRSIVIEYCSNSIVSSTVDILDEQEIQGNDGIQIEVWLDWDNEQLNLEARDNLKVNNRGTKTSTLNRRD